MNYYKITLNIANKRICASSQFHDFIGCHVKVLPRMLYVIGSSQGGEEKGYDHYTPFFGEKILNLF
jgi:hypothetical protein